MMVDNPLRGRIETFVRNVGEHVDQNYVLVEDVTPEEREYILERGYIHRVISHPENLKSEILDVLEASWYARIKDGQEHRKKREWGRAASGFAHHLLKPKKMDQVNNIEAAADLIVRMSRWYHTRNCNVWIRFRPYARRVVELTWGDIEQLY